MENKKTMLLDVDEVVCFAGFLDSVNEFMGTNYVIDDFTDYYIDEVAVPKERFEEFNKFVSTKNLYENAHILPNAVSVIEKLNEYYDIHICSSCVNPFDVNNSGKVFKDKYDFLLSTLPFISPKKYIFTDDKSLLYADIQIDDVLKKLNPHIKTKILFPSYHNKDITPEELEEKGVIRAGMDWREGWNEVEKILIDEPKLTKKIR